MASHAPIMGTQVRAPKIPAQSLNRTPLEILRALPGPLARKYAQLDPSAGPDLVRARRLARLFAAFDRDDMECAVDLLLLEMNARDGDVDLEEVGGEDSFCVHEADGPGCPISDTDLGIEDQREGSTIEDIRQGGGSFVEDPDIEDDDRAGRKEHLTRIQLDRCTPRVSSYRDWPTRRTVSEIRGYDLIDEPIVPTARKLLGLRWSA